MTGSAQAIRRLAEETLRQQVAKEPKRLASMSAEEIQLVLHELQVHQIQLEIQNEELRRMQVELDATRARYFDLYELAPIGYCKISEHGQFLEVNLTATTLLGINQSALKGKRISESIFKEDQDIYYLHRILLIETGKLQSCELRMVKSDATVFWTHMTALVAQEPDGTAVHRIVLRDITERKRAEEALRESEQRFKTLSNSGMALIWTSGIDKLCNYFNSVWLEFTGRTLDEEMGNGWTEGVHPDDFQLCLDIYVRAFNRQEKFSMEYRLRRHDGEYRWIVDEGCPRYDSQGEFIGYINHCLDIDDRKRLEEKLRENLLRYELVLEGASGGIWDWNVPNKTVHFSSRWKELRGFLDEEIGDSETIWSDNIHPDEKPAVMAKIESHFAGKTVSFEADYRVRCKDGSWKWIHDRGKAIRDANGKVIRMAGSNIDITGRKLDEEAKVRLENRLHMAQEAAQSGTWEWNLLTNENIWSDELWKLYGLELKSREASYETWLGIVHPDDRAQTEEIVQQAASSKSELNVEWRTLLQDGTTRWLMSRGKPVFDDNGQAIQYLGVVIDITDRKQAELNYHALFNEMLDGFALHEIIVDDVGIPVNYRFLAVNPAFENMTGLKAADIIGHTVVDILPDTEMCWIETYGRVAQTGEPVHLEEYASALKKHFEVTAYRPAPGQFACVFTDVTEKKQANEEKKRLQVQLQQAQKMEAIGTLAGGIAHDFNNVLSAVLGYAEMVQEDSPVGSRTRDDIDQVVKASHRAKELVKQILTFSRQAETEHVPLQPASIIKEAVKMLRSSLPSTIDIQQDVDPDAGLILADPTQIHQVLVNLCTNAFHAMEETGGILTISLKSKFLTHDDLHNQLQVQPGQFVHLSIGDTGSGIAVEIQEKMFDPYFTTKEIGKGTGMGLAILHGIVKSYKGFVTYSSRPGEGTVFHVYLPVIQDPAALEIESVPLDLMQLGNERILFIDDEEILAGMGQAMLERLGYRVTVRRNSIEALNTFQNHPDQFDLVITDQTMPGMTGCELARRILQIRPGMPIILCTGYSSFVSEEKARSLGIKGFAFKPLSKINLAALIRTALDQDKKGSS